MKRALKDIKPTYHALLIDEWQDFMNPWTRLAFATVKPGHGGVTLAGDPMQALYRDGDGDTALAGRKVEIATLTRPYRSTRQILEVTSALDETMDVIGRDCAFEGKPVDLVWAENTSAIASAIGRDVHLLLVNEERKPQDIGVLVTRKWDMGKVVVALKNEKVPVKAIYPNQVDEFDLADPSCQGHDRAFGQGL